MILARLIPTDPNYDFMKAKVRWTGLILSGLLSLASIVLCFTQGLNFGIDFLGGAVVELQTEGPADLAQMRGILNNLNLGEIQLTSFGAPDLVQIKALVPEGDDRAISAAVDTITTSLRTEYGAIEIRRRETVGPSVGSELIDAGIIATLASLAGILIYIGARFEFAFGVGAILATLHDVTIMFGVFALFQLDFNLTAVAAILTIAGYSVNDTVVTFDRIREMLRKYKRESVASIINRAINATLARTFLTATSTLLATIALWIFAGEAIRNFVIAMAVGIIVGTYSSIFIAGPVLLFFRLRPEQRASADKALPAAKPAASPAAAPAVPKGKGSGAAPARP